jgi:glutaredoxin
MQARTIALCVFAASLAAPFFANAQTTVYRWVDKDGKVQFSDSPPPAEAKGASQRRMGGGETADSPLPYATQVAARRNPVALYTGTSCRELCARGRELLEQRGIPFVEHDAESNRADREALKNLTGTTEVPVLVVGENKFKGFDESAWHASLDGAGYPKTRLPGQLPLRTVAPSAPPPKAPDTPPAPAPDTPPPPASN